MSPKLIITIETGLNRNKKGAVPLLQSRQGKVLSGLQNVENGIGLLIIRIPSFTRP